MRTVTVGLILAIVAGCSTPKPYVFSRAQLKDDGVHVELDLTNLDQVTIEGQVVREGDDFVLPLSRFHIGANRIPIEAPGLEGETVYLDVEPRQLLELECFSGTGRIEIAAEDAKPGGSLTTNECGVVDGGYLRGKLRSKNGATVKVNGEPLVDDELKLDVRPALWGAKAPKVKSGQEIRAHEELTAKVEVVSADGETWTATATYRSGGADLFGPFIAGLPASAAGMPEGDGIALQWNGGWTFEDADTVGEIDRFVLNVARGEPRYLTTCHYQDQRGKPVDIKTVSVDMTFRIVDRAGTELARKTFPPRPYGGCSELQYEGGGDVTVVPDEQAILAWARQHTAD